MASKATEAGLTPRSLAASILCIVLTAFYTNYSGAFLREHYQIVNQAIPIPAVLSVLVATVVVGLAALVAGRRLLTRAELVCVAFATMMSAPLASEGFWQRWFGIVASVPRAGAFDYIDVYDDGLWPHGRNVLDGTFRREKGEDAYTGPWTASSANVSWSQVEYEDGASGLCPTVSNSSAADDAWIELSLPVTHGATGSIEPTLPHLASVLGRIEGAEAESEAYLVAFADDNPTPKTLIASRSAQRRTLVHRRGFVRMGSYGTIPAESCASNLVLRLGYRGRGRATFADPKLFSVHALESCFRGRKMVDEKDWLAMDPATRPAGAVVRPSNMLSWKGARFLLSGYIPLRDWIRPAFVWTSFVLLLLGALFCVNAIMRRQWAESERYPMPNSRIPLSLSGAADDGDSPWPAMWRSRCVWAGLVFALAYGAVRGWHFFKPDIPDIGVNVALGDYVTNRAFGKMFDTSFVFSLTVCCVAVFFELNVLLSIVVGYWVCRTTYCLGHLAGLDMSSGFPWREQAAAGSYAGYFIVVVALSSKYIWSVLKDAVRRRSGQDETLSPRAAVVALIAAHALAAAWARLAGAPPLPTMALFAMLVAIGFVCTKFRAECGTPYGYFAPASTLILISAAGGFATFGERGVFMSILLTACFSASTFFLIPGMQFELIETGRRLRISPRHIALTCLVGALGGLLVGGWAFLTHGYADGGDNIRGSLLFNGFGWFANSFRGPLSSATNDWLNSTSSPLASSPWETRSMLLGGCATAAITVLRHYVSGFWFHPVGFILGWTNMDSGAPWGTILAAWFIRYATLKIGGARAVREKLIPFFTGAFIGCVLCVLLFTVLNGLAYASGSPDFAGFIP